ncbi:MAG TPA: hypothetical protein VE932_04960 [Patescibacteria group bacterium]|nr:hypothetical protein [Patescibacteria group bacterium]
MMNERQQPGTPRIRGHRHAGGPLGRGARERHYIAAIVSGVVAAVASGVSLYASSEQQAAAADYNKKVARNQADAAREAAVVAEANERDKNRRIMAASRASAAASGVSEDEGTSLLTQMESASTAELNARRIRWAGANQIQGFQNEAVLQGFLGPQARRAGYLTSGTKLLTGATEAYGAYQRRPTTPTSPSQPPAYDPTVWQWENTTDYTVYRGS